MSHWIANNFQHILDKIQWERTNLLSRRLGGRKYRRGGKLLKLLHCGAKKAEEDKTGVPTCSHHSATLTVFTLQVFSSPCLQKRSQGTHLGRRCHKTSAGLFHITGSLSILRRNQSKRSKVLKWAASLRGSVERTSALKSIRAEETDSDARVAALEASVWPPFVCVVSAFHTPHWLHNLA